MSSNLRIGDYFQYGEEILLVNQLKVNPFPKCYEISVGTCNCRFDISRWQEAQYDDTGNVIKLEGNLSIVKSLYGVMTFNTFTFATNAGSIGTIPDSTLSFQVQYNSSTKNILEGDTFTYCGVKYEIVSLDTSQVDLDLLDGILTFYTKRAV